MRQRFRICGGRDGARDAEVREHRVIRLEKNVLGFDVAMDDAARVRVLQRARDLARDPHRVLHGELSFAREPIAQRLAVHERHDVVERAFCFAGIVRRQNVGMRQACCDLDLAMEPVGADGRGQIGVQQLDGDLAIELGIDAQVNSRHSPPTKLALDTVALTKRRQCVTHRHHGDNHLGGRRVNNTDVLPPPPV